MNSLKIWLAIGCVSLSAAFFIGCGSGGSATYNVSGSVTYDGGKPVPRGRIQFIPDTSKGNKGTAGYADIVDGKYDTATKGQGTVGGPHIVEIQGFDGNAKPEEELPLGTPLFDEYETKHNFAEGQDDTANFEVTKDQV